MAKVFKGKNHWALFLLLLAGIVLGGFIGTITAKVPILHWLSYGKSFGMVNPLVIDIGIMVITFGLSININLASIIGVILAIIIYRTI